MSNIKPYKESVCKHCNDDAIRKTIGGLCFEYPFHYQKNQQNKYREKQALKPKKIIKPKPKKYKATGELALFLKIYAERKGLCEITKEPIKFDVGCFAHILSKGAYPSFRLVKDNIIMVKKEIHTLYDDRGKEDLLKEYPGAEIIYLKKDELRLKYYQN